MINKFTAKIAVFGGRIVPKDLYMETVKIGQLMARENWLVFCGGGAGVMEAISRGVKLEKGTCIGILKGTSDDEGNQYLSVPIKTGMGVARNAILAYNCDAAVAIGGQYGTLSEIAYASLLFFYFCHLNFCPFEVFKTLPLPKPHLCYFNTGVPALFSF